MRIPVCDPSLPELEIYASKNEAQLKHYYEPAPGIFIAETANVILRAMDAGFEPLSLLLEDRYLAPDFSAPEELRLALGAILERTDGLPVYTAPLDVISQISGFKQSRGILCAMRRKAAQKTLRLPDSARRVAVLEDVENPTNVGAVFRSAAALGFDAVLLTPGCADPLYRRAARVSMGGVFRLYWDFARPEQFFPALRENGFLTAAMALSDSAVALDSPALKRAEKLALFFGNEENGLTPQTSERCDYTVKIPMENRMDSLNIAASAAVAFWELRK